MKEVIGGYYCLLDNCDKEKDIDGNLPCEDCANLIPIGEFAAIMEQGFFGK